MKLPDPPFDIPPRGTLTVLYTVQPFRPGPFGGQLHLFASDGRHTREHVVRLAGVAGPDPASRDQ